MRRRIHKNIGNTSVLAYTYDDHEKVVVELHDNRIATLRFKEGKGFYDLELTTCGWNTGTTLRRLNALLQNVCGHGLAKFRIIDGECHLFYWNIDLGVYDSVTREQYMWLCDEKFAELRATNGRES